MSTMAIIIVFSVTWWMVLFIALPIGVKTAEHPETGHATSAPTRPMIGKKMAYTTLISVLFTCIFWFLLTYGYLDFIELRPLTAD